MKMIVAVDKNWGIGYKGQLLCHLSGDLKYFKATTMGNGVIMGRTTLGTLPGKKGLPGRKNIILTRDIDFSAERIDKVYNKIEDLISDYIDDDNVFVIGGASVYEQLMPYCNEFYVTKIEKEFKADRYIQNLDEVSWAKLVSESEVMEENGIKYRYLVYERK